jgi:hypothetical protein
VHAAHDVGADAAAARVMGVVMEVDEIAASGEGVLGELEQVAVGVEEVAAEDGPSAGGGIQTLPLSVRVDTTTDVLVFDVCLSVKIIILHYLLKARTVIMPMHSKKVVQPLKLLKTDTPIRFHLLNNTLELPQFQCDICKMERNLPGNSRVVQEQTQAFVETAHEFPRLLGFTHYRLIHMLCSLWLSRARPLPS